MVDDPYIFGQITAANALSDIYAMGGDPKFALNIVGFPICNLPITILKDILKGAASKLTEAGVTIIGGHSIDDPQPKYGLSVSGFVDPMRIWKNDNCREGQDIILTKPLGTGIITTAIKGEMASEESTRAAVAVMTTLNKVAKEVIENYTVNCCTDITGFGLIGHSAEIAQGAGVDIIYDVENIPTIVGAVEYASYGLVPAGAYRNRDYFGKNVILEGDLNQELDDILYDPQTSGGLLFSCDPAISGKILDDLIQKGVQAKKIGVSQKGSGNIILK